jgi:integrase/recombinase XerC
MEKLIEQFLEHLRYERNVSAHTLRNYESDLEQFTHFLAPDRKTKLPDVSEIDHLTIREWMASLHSADFLPVSRA